MVLVRQAVRKWAAELGFSLVDQTKIVTAASELARNALVHGGGGTVRLECVEEGQRRGLRLTFEDQGPGIADIELALTRRLHDRQRSGLGLSGRSGWSTSSRSFPGRARARVSRHEVEVISAIEHRRPCRRPSQPGRRSRGGQRRRWPTGSVSTRRGAARSRWWSRRPRATCSSTRGGGELAARILERGDGVGGVECSGPGPGAGYGRRGPLPARRLLDRGFAGHRPRGHRPAVGPVRHPLAPAVGHGACWPDSGPRPSPASRPTLPALELGAVTILPKPGEEVCGDAWAVEQATGGSPLLVVDGLGHGPLAAEAAARQPWRIFREHTPRSGRRDPIDRMHAPCRHHAGRGRGGRRGRPGSTRMCGSPASATLRAPIFAARHQPSMVSHNGTVGHALRKVQEFVYPFPAGAVLVMHSDGLATHWQPGPVCRPGGRHPA